MENLTTEMAAAMLRASDSAVVCTRGGRVDFANPAAVRILGCDPAGQSAAAVLPERLLKLQGSLGAASWRVRGRDGVVTMSSAGLYRCFFLRLLPQPRRMPPLPTPEWTVLANLRMAAEHLKNTVQDGAEADRLHAARMMKSYYQLHRWFTNVTTLSALQEGTLPFQPTATDCKALLQRIAAQLRPLAEARGIQVIAQLPEQTPPLQMDETLLERMLLNLLLNSLLHCAAGGRIRLGLTMNGERVTFTVQDTGSSIAPERMGSLFLPYDRHPEHDPFGAGCGLQVALGIALLHGGELLLESSTGTGTAVMVSLPRTQADHVSLQSDASKYDSRDLSWFYSGLAEWLEESDLM